MKKPLSRRERDDCGSSQTSIRRHPPGRSTMREYAVAPIQHRGVAMRHVGPRDATWVPLSISTWTASSRVCRCTPDWSLRGDTQVYINILITNEFYSCNRNRERLAWGAGGGNEPPGAPARCRR